MGVMSHPPLGNATEESTTKEVFNYIKKNSKVKVARADIQEIKTSGSNSFKVTVDKCEVEDFINKTKWPKHLTVKAFKPSRRKSSKPRQQGQSQMKGKNMMNNRRKKFQKTQRYRRDYIPRERPYKAYNQNTGNRYQNEYPPGGYNSGYSRDYNPGYSRDYRY